MDLGAGSVIAGGFSAAALNTLRSLRVTVYPHVSGTVQDALLAWQAGRMAPVSAAASGAAVTPGGTGLAARSGTGQVQGFF